MKSNLFKKPFKINPKQVKLDSDKKKRQLTLTQQQKKKFENPQNNTK